LDEEFLDSIVISEDLKFNSISELDNFLELFFNEINLLNEVEEIVIYIDEFIDVHSETNSLGDQRSFTVTDTVSWWAPTSAAWGLASFFHWKNIDFTYTYSFINGQPVFTRINSVNDSWTTGFDIGSWEHRRGSGFVNSNNTATISADGTYFLGVEFWGLPIGFSWNETWETNVRFS